MPTPWHVFDAASTARKSLWPSCAAAWIASGPLPVWGLRKSGCWCPSSVPSSCWKNANTRPLPMPVSPRNRYFGIMLPYTPLHHLLLDAGFSALVMTSANLSEEPIAIDNAEALGAWARLPMIFWFTTAISSCAATTPSCDTAPATCVPSGAPGATCPFPCF
jgi:hypothetical protein